MSQNCKIVFTHRFSLLYLQPNVVCVPECVGLWEFLFMLLQAAGWGVTQYREGGGDTLCDIFEKHANFSYIYYACCIAEGTQVTG